MLTKMPSLAEKEDPRVKRTRQLLVQAFEALLQEKGFEGMTVQDIADRATVNRATFYAHFEDKHALLDYVANESFQQALASKLPHRAELNTRSMQLLIEIVCEYLEWHSVHCKPSMSSQFDAQLEQQVMRQLYQVLLAWYKGVAFNGSSTQDDAELRATAASWSIYGLAQRWSQGDRKEPAAEFARRAMRLISSGFDLPAPKVGARG